MELDRPAAAYHLFRRVIQQRPYEGSTYAAIGQCLSQLGSADMAMVFYELALGCQFQNQSDDFRKIVATHYASLLRRVAANELPSSVQDFAVARAESLKRTVGSEEWDLIVSMMWNTDQTDVDLHVREPTGEECSYRNRKTRIGGQITSDIRNGFGPEMYRIETAPEGEFDVRARLYRSHQNRTNDSNMIFLTIYRDYGRDNEQVVHKTVLLQEVDQQESVQKIIVD